jgi:hypothetical protein
VRKWTINLRRRFWQWGEAFYCWISYRLPRRLVVYAALRIYTSAYITRQDFTAMAPRNEIRWALEGMKKILDWYERDLYGSRN